MPVYLGDTNLGGMNKLEFLREIGRLSWFPPCDHKGSCSFPSWDQKAAWPQETDMEAFNNMVGSENERDLEELEKARK